MEIFECVHICSDKFYEIVGYELLSRQSGKIRLFSPNELRFKMATGEVQVSNLRLGQDLQIEHADVKADAYERFLDSLSKFGWIIKHKHKNDYDGGYYIAHLRHEAEEDGIKFTMSSVTGQRKVTLYQKDVERYQWNQVVLCHLIVSDVIVALEFIRKCKQTEVTATYCCEVILGTIYKSTVLEEFSKASRMIYSGNSSNAILNGLPLIDQYNNHMDLPAAYKVNL